MPIGSVEMTLLILLAAILVGPILAERFHVPGLLGLIFLGMVFGPFMVGWLSRGGLVSDLGQVGILYLMFLAGLGFNLKAFADNRTSAIVFGLAGFAVPFFLSVFVTSFFLDFALIPAALVGAMWASNTLVAYPEVRAAGMENTRSVRDAVSAGVVADLLSLLVLAVATTKVVIEAVDEEATVAQPASTSLPLVVTVPLLVLFSLWVLPRIGRWFFVRVGRSRAQRFVFALAGMAVAATLAVAAGVEGIIGAFLAGLGLNRLVPHNSELMDRLDFVGSTVFVPAFLVSVGLSIDPSAFFDLGTLGLGVLFTSLVIVGKTGAAFVASRFTGYSLDEIGLMSSLSFGQAASTLAIAQVGLGLGLFDQQVVNASVIAIVLTALITSIGTRFFLNRIPRPVTEMESIGQRVLVDVQESSSQLERVIEAAGRIARGDDGILIPYATPERGSKASGRERVTVADAIAASAGHDTEGIVRISETFSDGTLELIEEIEASLVLLSWQGPRLGTQQLMGSEVDSVGESSPVPTAAVHLVRPWQRVVLALGDTRVQWHRDDARLAAELAKRLRRRDGVLLVAGTDAGFFDEVVGTGESIERLAPGLGVSKFLDQLHEDDVVVAPSYLFSATLVTDRLRLATRLADANVIVVGGPGRLSVTPNSAPRRMERILGPQA